LSNLEKRLPRISQIFTNYFSRRLKKACHKLHKFSLIIRLKVNHRLKDYRELNDFQTIKIVLICVICGKNKAMNQRIIF